MQDEETEPVGHVEAADQDIEQGESAEPTASAESRKREPLPSRPPPVREPQPEPERGPKIPAVTEAIEQVNQVIAELRHALDEMEGVLETLELAERQKIDDDREIESLQRALRRLHRPRDDEPRQR